MSADELPAAKPKLKLTFKLVPPATMLQLLT